MINNTLQKINSEIRRQLKFKVLNYGESHKVITENTGFNYRSIESETPCSVDDNYDLVLFFVRQNSTPDETEGRGLKQKLSRSVNYKLVANSKLASNDYNLNYILNNIKEVQKIGTTDNNSRSIAQTYFGIDQFDFTTYFLAIDFYNNSSPLRSNKQLHFEKQTNFCLE
jgi:hypothetical protein